MSATPVEEQVVEPCTCGPNTESPDVGWGSEVCPREQECYAEYLRNSVL